MVALGVNMSDVDTIVIGSGAGGLAAAVAMARSGEKVLVLEQHDVPGGWCHSFRLGGHWFSPGVHYLGELGEGGRMRRLYEGLGVANDLTFLELNPDGFDHLTIGKEKFDIPKGKENLIQRLKERFPNEAKGIDRYFEIVNGILREMGPFLPETPVAEPPLWKMPFVKPYLSRWGLRSLKSTMDSCMKDPLLKAILAVQIGDTGLGTSEIPTAVHASVQGHYFDGGYYPKGGGAAIPRAFLSQLKKNGGQLKVKSGVRRILVEKDLDGTPRAIGVVLDDGTQIRSKRVISNADPAVTLGRLVNPEFIGWRTKRALAKTRWSVSAISLFMAADVDAEALGLDSGNYWYNENTDVDEAFRLAEGKTFDGSRLAGQFLTCTSLKDRSKGLGNTHTFEAFAFVPYEGFREWTHTRYGERPADYAEMKKQLTDKMLVGLERFAPGLSSKVTFAELGTPLTNEHYCASTKGNLYGTAKTRAQVGPFAWQIRSEVKDLFLVGASTVGHGVFGGHVSGVLAAAKALKINAAELLRAEGQSIRILPCDDTSAWPLDMQERMALKRGASTEAVA